MPHAGTYVLASLISGVSAALILASGPSYTETRSLQGTDVDGGRSTYDGCQNGPCRIAYLNSVEDFCLWAPSQPAATRVTEHTLVAWCVEGVPGSHVIPDGTILGAHLVITPEYVQITGIGELTNINVPPDSVVSASGQGYNGHGFVVTSVYGQLEQIREWTSFVSQEHFCFRACRSSAVTSEVCAQIHDMHECLENISGNYAMGVFEDCIADGTEVSSALYQEILAVPSLRSARSLSYCTTRGTIANTHIAHARRAIAPIPDTSLSRSQLSFSSTPASCIVPTTTNTVSMTMTSSFPKSISNTTNFMSSNVSSTSPPASPMCSYAQTYTQTNIHTHSHLHPHTHRRSHHRSSTLPLSSSSHHSTNHSPSPRTASSLPIPSTPSSTSTFPVSDSSFSGAATTSVPIPSLSSVSSITSSSVLSQSSYISSFTNPSLPSPVTSSTTSSSSVSPSTSPDTSDVLTFTTTASSSVPTTYSASSPSLVSPSTLSPSPSPTSSQSSYLLSFTTPSSGDPTTSSTSSSPTVPNSQTQIGSQCPPLWNAGSITSPLPPLMFTILTIVVSSYVGIVVF